MRLLIIPLLFSSLFSQNYRHFVDEKSATANMLNRLFILQDTVKQPEVKLEQTTVPDMHVLYIVDSAANMNSLTKVFETGYSELFAFIGANGLRAGKVMAFHLTNKDPIKLEITVEINKTPSAALIGRIKHKLLKGGDALVVHYKGPYEQMEIPYNAINQWLKQYSKQPKGFPYEVYINSPTMVKDKFDLKTDIYQLLQ